MKVYQKIESVYGNINNTERAKWIKGCKKWIKNGKWQFIIGAIIGVVTSYVASFLWHFTIKYFKI
jgi:hypothetical protein